MLFIDVSSVENRIRFHFTPYQNVCLLITIYMFFNATEGLHNRRLRGGRNLRSEYSNANCHRLSTVFAVAKQSSPSGFGE